ncbi:MAG: Ig-like domain-containing protein [Bacteroidales bacterium]|nr:Ig-like domain-containing protein [Bacteroidales bacterium]
MKTKILMAAIFLGAIVLFAGCKKDDFVEITGVCPIVVSTIPANGATSVPLAQVITVKFNEEMDPSSITSASFFIRSSAVLTGTYSYNDSTATFTPGSPLTANTTYTGTVTTDARDLNGNYLQTDYVWSFSTGTTLAPMVTNTDPADLETGVVLNKTVEANFNMPMNAATINTTTFTLMDGVTNIPGVVTYSGTTANFNPNADLNVNTEYTATITTGAENTTGDAIPADYVWTFTTGTLVAPTVISTDPADLATDVPLNKIITADFSETMNATTINGTTFTLSHGAVTVAGIVSYAGVTATFTPTDLLLSGTTYTATITNGAENVAGTSLVSNYVWTFNTIATTGPDLPDLNTVADFGIIAGVGISNNAGFSVINDMNVGISPGVRSSITGFPPAIVVNGAIYASDDLTPVGVAAMLIQAKQDLTDAYLFAEGASSPAPATVSGDIGGMTLAPGIYKSTSTLLIQSGDLTLDAQGDVNAGWIFQVASDFTTVGGAGGNVILTGGAQAKNVYWQVGSSATIGDFTSFKGNVMALTSITMNSGATATGRMLARNGAVVMTSTNIINKP